MTTSYAVGVKPVAPTTHWKSAGAQYPEIVAVPARERPSPYWYWSASALKLVSGRMQLKKSVVACLQLVVLESQANHSLPAAAALRATPIVASTMSPARRRRAQGATARGEVDRGLRLRVMRVCPARGMPALARLDSCPPTLSGPGRWRRP